jgi:hypothetical protein
LRYINYSATRYKIQVSFLFDYDHHAAPQHEALVTLAHLIYEHAIGTFINCAFLSLLEYSKPNHLIDRLRALFRSSTGPWFPRHFDPEVSLVGDVVMCILTCKERNFNLKQVTAIKGFKPEFTGIIPVLIKIFQSYKVCPVKYDLQAEIVTDLVGKYRLDKTGIFWEVISEYTKKREDNVKSPFPLIDMLKLSKDLFSWERYGSKYIKINPTFNNIAVVKFQDSDLIHYDIKKLSKQRRVSFLLDELNLPWLIISARNMSQKKRDKMKRRIHSFAKVNKTGIFQKSETVRYSCEYDKTQELHFFFPAIAADRRPIFQDVIESDYCHALEYLSSVVNNSFWY